jgi:hypothetical protein
MTRLSHRGPNPQSQYKLSQIKMSGTYHDGRLILRYGDSSRTEHNKLNEIHEHSRWTSGTVNTQHELTAAIQHENGDGGVEEGGG